MAQFLLTSPSSDSEPNHNYLTYTCPTATSYNLNHKTFKHNLIKKDRRPISRSSTASLAAGLGAVVATSRVVCL